jgi:uncharacterized protein
MEVHQTDLISMFFLGLMGTGHCIGMCGPLIFAFPGSTGRFSAHLWYHAGRIGAYTLGGAMVTGFSLALRAIAVNTVDSSLPLMVWIQFCLSSSAAVFMLLFGLIRFGLLPEPTWMTVVSPENVPGLKRFLRAALTAPRGAKLLMLGMIMGYIPCGLSYAAFTMTLPCGDLWTGALLMLMFGLGTLPGLLFIGTGFSRHCRRFYSFQTSKHQES